MTQSNGGVQASRRPVIDARRKRVLRGMLNEPATSSSGSRTLVWLALLVVAARAVVLAIAIWA